MNEEKKLTELLEDLNTNIEILSKITALTFRKDSLFKGKETKEEQVEVLDDLKLPDNVIALIIGSTPDSVKSLRSLRKAKARKAKAKKVKAKKTQKTESVKSEGENK